MNNELVTSQTNDLVIIDPQPLDQNPAAVYLAGLSESGRRSQLQVLNVIAKLLTGSPDAFMCDWSRIRFQHTTAVRSKLQDLYAPATVNKALSALRKTLKAAWQLDQMSAEDYHKAASIESVNGHTIPAGRELSAGEIAALLGACENDPTPAGARDAAVLAVMYASGLRREEIVNLDLGDYNQESGRLVVSGKRRKDRTAYLLNGASRALNDWLDVRNREPGPLFMPINKAGAIQYRRMTTQAVYNLLNKRAKLAGVDDFSPHDLRRTFVSDLLDAGADIAIVAKMAGHASVNTTARYDRRPEAAKMKAAQRLHVPYHGRK
jgi:site-specific recombinase XerD